ncbi:MAG: hypothetical protein ACSHW7_05125 [Patiriisocius sp.]|uniref:hypothetical protein n=1 Tax=Patiriisocius sp. TaxID=2822396 RepID=UPI003EF24EFF
MKNLFITIPVFLLFTLGAFAQNMDNVQVEKSYISSQTTPVFKGYKNTRGSIYLNEEFQRGSILMDNQIVAANVGLRYNVNDEQMELLENLNSTSTVANVVTKDKKFSIIIGNKTFVYLPSPDTDTKDGYFIVLEEGKNLTLYNKVTKEFFEGTKSFNSYSRDVPDTFKEKEKLYISKNEGTLEEVANSKSKRRKIFSNNTEQIKSYIKEENLNIRNDEDFAKAIKYANTLM